MKSSFYFLVNIVVGILCWPSIGHGQIFHAAINLSEEPHSFGIDSEFSWLESSDDKVAPETLPNDKWQNVTRVPNVGAGSDIIWYRFTLHNIKDSNETYVFTSMDAIVSEYVELRVMRTGQSVEEIKTGTSFSKSQRPMKTRLLALPFKMKPHETLTAFLGIKSNYNRGLLYQIRTVKSLEQFEIKSAIFFGTYFGILTLALLLITAMYFYTKDHLVLSYAGMCLTTLLTSSIGMGFVNYLIPSYMVFESGLSESIIVYLALTLILWFSRDYLQMNKSYKLVWSIFSLALVLSLLLAFLTFAFGHRPHFGMISKWIINVCGLLGIITAILGVWKNNSRFAQSYLIGFGVYNVGGGIWAAQFSGDLPTNWWTVHSIFVSQIFLNIVLAIVVIRNLQEKMLNVVASQESKKYGERMANMVRVLTHDLSNYISIIDITTNLLASERAQQDLRRVASQKIKKALTHQKELIDSVKELIALEDGKSNLEIGAVDVYDLLAELESTFEHRTAEKDVTLRIHSDGQDLKIIAERRTLYHSVLCNIVSNAIKFSDPHDSVDLKVSADKDQVLVRISDQGIGIPPSILDNLFSNSKKTSRLGTQGETGTGYGLPICKAYMELYGGQIAIESHTKESLGRDPGTTVTLSFRRVS